jgi:hypothetical protein
LQTIVFFHRLELTSLFAAIAKALTGKVGIVHLAYGEDEVQTLRNLGVTQPVTVFKEEIRRLYSSSSINQETLAKIDDLFIRRTSGAFNLNGAIQSDRGFGLLNLEEAERLTLTYHRFWSDFLERHDPAIVLHENCSLMFNFVAAMLCEERGVQYMYPILTQGLNNDSLYHLLMSGFQLACPDLDRALAAVDQGMLPIQQDLCARFIAEYRKDMSIYLGSSFNRPSLIRLCGAALVSCVRRIRHQNRFDRIYDNIDFWETQQNYAATKLFNLLRYRWSVCFEEPVEGEAYYFYPFHLEPEAVVLYQACGFYTNQVKLIQNIAAQLPAGTMLYVKDHPHDIGYRSAEDYRVLQMIPNVRLIISTISAKRLISKSLGVITLAGTAGFEAVLSGKPVFVFAKTYYCSGPGVVQLHHVRDLRAAIYTSTHINLTRCDYALHRYLTAYFAAARVGNTNQLIARSCDEDEWRSNAERVGLSIMATLKAT